MLEKILIAIISVLTTALVSLIITLIKTQSGKAKRRKQKEIQEERQKALAEGLKPIHEELSKIEQGLNILQKGVQSHIRLDLREEYNKYIKKGFASSTIRDDLESLYVAYHNLGKNGVMDNLREKFLALPTEAPSKQKTNKGE